MCLAIPMQVLATDGSLHVQALDAGGAVHRLNAALLPGLSVGDWVLAFLGSVRERIDAQRAAEVQSLLDALSDLAAGDAAAASSQAGFALPSALDAEQLRALTGSA